jgi:hypothetical protein
MGSIFGLAALSRNPGANAHTTARCANSELPDGGAFDQFPRRIQLAIFGLPYVEWNPKEDAVGIPSGGLTAADVRKGLGSTAFTLAAKRMKDAWCQLLTEAFTPTTINTQGRPEHRWTIHPAVDGCSTDGSPLPPPPPH